MSRFLPIPASAHAGQVDLVLTLVHVLMLVMLVGWSAYFTWVLVRFRRGRQPRANHAGATGRFALGTEIGVVVAEVVLLVGFALPLWYSRTAARPADANAVVVRVVAEQFAWNVHYPGADGQFGTTSVSLVTSSNPIGLDRKSPFGADDIVLLSEMHLPVNRPVVIQLSSKDVIHSFGVPAMRVKQDAIPGMSIPVWFIPNRIGEYEIACSQLCGLGHFRMRGFVTIQSAADFQKWMGDQLKELQPAAARTTP
jgi:cytochrome c oxidase subunit 2